MKKKKLKQFIKLFSKNYSVEYVSAEGLLNFDFDYMPMKISWKAEKISFVTDVLEYLLVSRKRHIWLMYKKNSILPNVDYNHQTRMYVGLVFCIL